MHTVSGDSATGSGTFTLNAARTELVFNITVETDKLTGAIAAAHFHNGAAGANGGVVRTITPDFVGNTASGTWKSTDAEPLTAAMVTELLAGRLYINVHTAVNAAGEIRGQVLEDAARFKDFGAGDNVSAAIELALPVPPNYTDIVNEELTNQLPTSGGDTQGLLFVDVSLVQVTGDAFGYGYGYRGGRGGGSIKITIRYTPPKVGGEYDGTVKVYFGDAERASSSTSFVVVEQFPAGAVVALSTLYPRSDEGALSRDLVVLRAKVLDEVAGRLVSVTVDPGLLGPKTDTMEPTSMFHPAILAKWGIDSSNPEADRLLPLKIIPQADPLTGTFSASIDAVDIAGQVFKLSGSTGAKVKVLETRETFNVYLMPGLNFISTPLECPTTTGDCTNFEFQIDDLLDNAVANAKSGFDTGGEVVEIIWYYCGVGTESTCPSPVTGDVPKFVSFSPGSSSDLELIGAGKGYIVKAKASAFETKLDAADTQFPATSVPVPIKLTFTGEAVANPGKRVPPSTDVSPVWNLVGLHSERDSTPDNLLQKVDVPRQDRRLWLQVFGFTNSPEVVLDDDGTLVRDPLTSRPLISLIPGRLENLSALSTQISAGSGFWLEMCGDDLVKCTSSIGPVLERK